MRVFLISLIASAAVLVGAAAVEPAAAADEGAALQEARPPGEPAGGRVDIDADADRGEARPWYLSPLWIGIGVVALLLVIVLAIASRGGGTTVVKT